MEGCLIASRLKLGVCVEKIVQREGVPPFCRHGTEVTTRALDPDSTSTDLARIVLKDMGLTSLILRVGNSAMYNRSGRPVMSVAHAIALLGWDTVRNLVSSARFIEHFAGRGAGVRELLLLSLLSATHSRDIATTIRYPAPDEAHVTGLLRNLGEVLFGCHYPEEYSLIILQMHTARMSGRDACRTVLEFSWQELGSAVAAAWNLPAKLVGCLRGTVPLASALDRSLASIAEYAHDLTDALYRQGAELDSVCMRWLEDPQGQRVRVPVRDLCRIVDTGRRETQSIFAALQIPTEDLRLKEQAVRAQAVLENTRRFDADNVRALDEAAESATRFLRRGDFDLNTLIAGLLNGIQTAGFDCAIFGLVSEDHEYVRGRLTGSGVDEDLLHRFQFRIDRVDGPMLAAVRRKNDLLVDRARDDRYDGSELVTAFGPAAFALFPVVVDGRVAGCIYAGRANMALGLDALRYSLSRVRDVIAAALRKTAQLAPN